MSPPAKELTPLASTDGGPAHDAPKAPPFPAEHAINSPSFVDSVRRAQRFRRQLWAAFGLSLLSLLGLVFLDPFTIAREGTRLYTVVGVLVIGLAIVLIMSPILIIQSYWEIEKRRVRLKQTAGAIALNDTPRPAPESAAGRLRSRWRMACVTSTIGLFTVFQGAGHIATGLWGLLSLVLLVAAIVSGALSKKVGRQMRLQERRRRSKIVELHDVPEGEFVLYLRSFTDDVVSARMAGGGLTMEEQFVRTLNQIGPVMTIGSPAEAQPHIGAYRLYLDNASWQQSVDQLLEKAKLVVIRTGLGGGLHWELERVVRRVSPQRVLMMVDDKVEMRRCLERLRSVQSQVSPSVRLGWGRPVCGVLGLLVFDERWRVSKLRLRGRGIYAASSRNFVEPGLARSLYPLFKALGVEWPRPTVSWLWLVLIPAGFLALFLFIIGFLSKASNS